MGQIYLISEGLPVKLDIILDAWNILQTCETPTVMHFWVEKILQIPITKNEIFEPVRTIDYGILF